VKRLLLAWYRRYGRELPWRSTRDPYAILVSEVMLQQTQVERVIPHFQRWLERWPTVEALAGASPAEVIVAWQGLGYNRRAVSLHRAACTVAERGWPEDLTDLPGIGPYTAAAVGNFAFGRDVLPVDTNVRRVQERTGEAFDADCAQALFDLGALLCLARVPRCGDCPLAALCSAARVPSRALSASAARSPFAPSPPGPTQPTRRPSPHSPATGSSRWRRTAGRRCLPATRRAGAHRRPEARQPSP
jgi:A/G-specific adenine glycosylase